MSPPLLVLVPEEGAGSGGCAAQPPLQFLCFLTTELPVLAGALPRLGLPGRKMLRV